MLRKAYVRECPKRDKEDAVVCDDCDYQLKHMMGNFVSFQLKKEPRSKGQEKADRYYQLASSNSHAWILNTHARTSNYDSSSLTKKRDWFS
jgi:hypothetical protein